MGINLVTEALDAVLPDERILRDLTQALAEAGGASSQDADIETEHGHVRISPDAEKAIVTKAFFKEYYDIPFGVYRVQVALGGVEKQQHGVLYARYCFATLYYNRRGEVITVDYHTDMR